MHTNHYFLRHLVKGIEPEWTNARLLELYTQEKNELIVHALSADGDPLYLKAYLSPSFCCLSFPEEHHRARRNSMNLFTQAENTHITNLRMYENERAFSFLLTDNLTLLFKMFGNRSNLILFRDNKVHEVFRSELRNDYSLTPDMDRTIAQGREDFFRENGHYPALFPTFGKQVRQYLAKRGYENKSLEEKWDLVAEVRELLNHPSFYVMDQNEVYLSLLPQPVRPFHDPVQALNHFFRQYFMKGLLAKEKNEVIGRLKKQETKTSRHLRKLYAKLDELQHRESYRNQADLLMAHLHNIPKGVTRIGLPDFNDPSKIIRITLNPRLSPQDNAAHLYQKAKKQHLEVEQLEQNIERSEAALGETTRHIEAIEPLGEVGALRDYIELHALAAIRSSAAQAVLPYREYNIDGFMVRVGKHAKGNDRMLQQYSFKDDLWLHAKDVAGSHVLIKYQSGRPYPKNVVEKAAALAAFYSKRKNDSLCPVIVTHRKYVRKRKGDPPGMVVVDREEEVRLVPPSDLKYLI